MQEQSTFRRPARGLAIVPTELFRVYLVFLFHEHNLTSLVVWWSVLLTTNHEVQGSIPGSTMEIFLVGGGSPW